MVIESIIENLLHEKQEALAEINNILEGKIKDEENRGVHTLKVHKFKLNIEIELLKELMSEMEEPLPVGP